MNNTEFIKKLFDMVLELNENPNNNGELKNKQYEDLLIKLDLAIIDIESRVNELTDYINEELIDSIEKEIENRVEERIKPLVKRCNELEEKLNKKEAEDLYFYSGIEEDKLYYNKFDPNISQSVKPRFGGGKQSTNVHLNKRQLGRDFDILNPDSDGFSNI